MFGSQSTGCVCRRQLVEPVSEFIFDNLLLSIGRDQPSTNDWLCYSIPFHSIYLYPQANGGRCVAMLDNQPEESSSSSS